LPTPAWSEPCDSAILKETLERNVEVAGHKEECCLIKFHFISGRSQNPRWAKTADERTSDLVERTIVEIEREYVIKARFPRPLWNLGEGLRSVSSELPWIVRASGGVKHSFNYDVIELWKTYSKEGMFWRRRITPLQSATLTLNIT
jgi:hypothetical protein